MTMEKEKDGLVGFGNYKPEKRPFFQEAGRFVYNKDTGAFLGRTPISWIKIITFYVIFYTCLACFFILLMFVLSYTLDPRIPKYKLDGSLIGTSPGLGFRPMPGDENSLSTLIWYRGSARDDFKQWTDALEAFLKDYKNPGDTPGRGANIYTCGYDNPKPKGKVCEVNFRSWHPCTTENNFNYHVQSPCIFLKLNRIFGWEPDFYELNELPSNMPDDLKKHIMDTYSINKNNTNYLKNIWVSCEGETPADIENLGRVEYIPMRGFPFYYFPYENNEGYQSPLVAIVVKDPKKGIIINVECKAWAKNIEYNSKDRLGSVHFELLID